MKAHEKRDTEDKRKVGKSMVNMGKWETEYKESALDRRKSPSLNQEERKKETESEGKRKQ